MGQWTEDKKEELVRMVEDEKFRYERLGSDGTYRGHVNWAALARRYGFSGSAPVQKQYRAITGKEA